MGLRNREDYITVSICSTSSSDCSRVTTSAHHGWILTSPIRSSANCLATRRLVSLLFLVVLWRIYATPFTRRLGLHCGLDKLSFPKTIALGRPSRFCTHVERSCGVEARSSMALSAGYEEPLFETIDPWPLKVLEYVRFAGLGKDWSFGVCLPDCHVCGLQSSCVGCGKFEWEMWPPGESGVRFN